MANSIVTHAYEGVEIHQRSTDGYINATAMCVATGSDVSEWLSLDSTFKLVCALAVKLGVELKTGISRNSVATRVSKTFPLLVIVKRGSPSTGGGTWIHPKLAVHLAQWCDPYFALQVSDWIEEWMTTGQNPIHQAISDRLQSRLALQQVERVKFANEIKTFLISIHKYDDRKYSGQFFAKVHDSLNRLITGETSKEMRYRLQDEMGIEVDESTLIRDYFPIETIELYRAMCRAAANLMILDQLHPLEAVIQAARTALPYGYQSQPVDFEVNIKRLAATKQVLQFKSFS